MQELPKKYVDLGIRNNGIERRWPVLGAIYRALMSFLGLLMAALKHGPGVEFHAAMATKALGLIGTDYPIRQTYSLITAPMDSFRYFEFDFFWKCLAKHDSLGRYLDISSPRLFNWRILASGRTSHAVITNPDVNDLQMTKELFRSTGLLNLCDIRSNLISELNETKGSFDTVVCISVLEHIPTHVAKEALCSLWDFIKPGGRLLLSVPCAANCFEEYININEYGLLSTEENGFTFGQRFYDENLLNSEILSIVGPAHRSAVFGELESGTFFRDRVQKLTNPNYPFWMEALQMASKYTYFNSVKDLPGVGVVAYEFIKQ